MAERMWRQSSCFLKRQEIAFSHSCWQVVDLENKKSHSETIFQNLLIFKIILRDINHI